MIGAIIENGSIVTSRYSATRPRASPTGTEKNTVLASDEQHERVAGRRDPVQLDDLGQARTRRPPGPGSPAAPAVRSPRRPASRRPPPAWPGAAGVLGQRPRSPILPGLCSPTASGRDTRTMSSPARHQRRDQPETPRTRAAGRGRRALAAAVDVARRPPQEIAEAEHGRRAPGRAAEGERVVSHSFACTSTALPGLALGGHRRPGAALADRHGRARCTCCPATARCSRRSGCPGPTGSRPATSRPGDVLPKRVDDPLLEQGYEATGDEDVDQLALWELGLGRARVLSPLGREEAAAALVRRRARPARPARRAGAAASARPAASSCRWPARCAQVFGVCANEWSPSDGPVVSLDHGCGAHSEVDVEHPPGRAAGAGRAGLRRAAAPRVCRTYAVPSTASRSDRADPFGTAAIRERVLAGWAAAPVRLREDANAEEDLASAATATGSSSSWPRTRPTPPAGRAAGPAALTLRRAARATPRCSSRPTPARRWTPTGVQSLATLRASAKRAADTARQRRPVRRRLRRGPRGQRRAGGAVPDRRGAVLPRRHRRPGGRGGRRRPGARRRGARRDGHVPVLRLPFAADGSAAGRLRHRRGAAAARRGGRRRWCAPSWTRSTTRCCSPCRR